MWSLIFPALLGTALAQSTDRSPPHSFNWGFNSTSDVIVPQCSKQTLFAKPVEYNSSFIPPFQFLQFSPAGVVTSPIGGNNDSLTWTVGLPAGSKMLMSMVDSGGNQGGTGGIYTVSSSNDKSCLNVPELAYAKLTTNATSLAACDPLQIDIQGGVKPYTVMIVVSGNPFITAALGRNDNRFYWYNTAQSNGNIFVVVQDTSGDYIVSNDFISTQGFTNSTCARTPFSEQLASNDVPLPPRTNASSKSTNHTGLIVGVVVGVLAAVAIAAGALYYIFVVQRRRQEEAAVKVYAPEIDPIHQEGTVITSPSSPGYQAGYPKNLRTQSQLYSGGPQSESDAMSQSGYNTVSYYGAPASSVGGYQPQTVILSPTSNADSEFIHHQDAGPVELPPSYGDQAGGSSAAANLPRRKN